MRAQGGIDIKNKCTHKETFLQSMKDGKTCGVFRLKNLIISKNILLN